MNFMFEAKEIISQNNDWISVIFIVIFLLLTVAKVLFNDRIFHTNTLFIQKKYLQIYFGREKNVVFNLFQTLLFIVKFLVLSLLIFQINIFFKLNNQLNGLIGYLIILIGVIVYFTLRLGLELFLARVLNFEKVLKKVLYDRINYFNNLVLWVLPFLILYTYTPSNKVLYFNIVFFFSMTLFVVRYLLILKNNKNLIFNNLFYFILYLCALEISPFVIVLKLTI